MRQCCRSFGRSCPIRCPMAAVAGILESARSLPMRMIASRWLGMDTVSESNAFSCEICAWNLAFLSRIDSASPESSISVREDPTRYNPNLSEEEPLFSVRIFDPGSASVMPYPAESTRSQVPAPVPDLRHVVAMLADIELVTLHGRPVTRCRRLHLIAEPRNSLDGVQRKLIAVKIVQHNHVKGVVVVPSSL